ncbi:hypothetical protein CAMRE0001_0162 [Campylobacter rectus RM3267]|uniref:Uncharacterized protein n=1 Tax=Campylobacter rectus RM3267 TaxID=553218 RepID=B9CXX1_CAMRE|nr:hypothetical protein CAMRE0001_0162 [Campylobacter rectus RM3267]
MKAYRILSEFASRQMSEDDADAIRHGYIKLLFEAEFIV